MIPGRPMVDRQSQNVLHDVQNVSALLHHMSAIKIAAEIVSVMTVTVTVIEIALAAAVTVLRVLVVMLASMHRARLLVMGLNHDLLDDEP